MKYIILYGMCVIAQMLLFTGCEDKEQVSSYLALDKDGTKSVVYGCGKYKRDNSVF